MKETTELRSWLSKNKIEEVINVLSSNQHLDKNLRNYLIQLSGRYNSWKENYRTETLDVEKSNIMLNKIRYDLILLIDEFKKEEDINGKFNEKYFFEKKVIPLYNQVVLIHEDWISSFVNYKNIISDFKIRQSIINKYDVEKIKLLISGDSDKSRHSRFQIKVKAKFIKNNMELTSFFKAFLSYMGIPSGLETYMEFNEALNKFDIKELRMDRIDNAVCHRVDIYSELYTLRIEGEMDRFGVLKTINEKIEELHNKFEIFESEYQILSDKYF